LYANTGGSGPSTFAAPTQSSYGQFAEKTWIGLGDVDGDGYPDVLSSDSSGNLVVQANIGGTGPGTFAAAGRPLGDYLNGMDLAALGDVDGNGRADLIARRASDNTVWYFESYLDSSGGPQLLQGVQVGYGADAFTAMSLADYTGDGHADLLALEGDGNLYFYPWIHGGLPPGFGGYGTLVVGSGHGPATMLAGGADDRRRPPRPDRNRHRGHRQRLPEHRHPRHTGLQHDSLTGALAPSDCRGAWRLDHRSPGRWIDSSPRAPTVTRRTPGNPAIAGPGVGDVIAPIPVAIARDHRVVFRPAQGHKGHAGWVGRHAFTPAQGALAWPPTALWCVPPVPDSC
jgi:hypothetical protein